MTDKSKNMAAQEWIKRNGTLTVALIVCILLAVFAGSFVFTPAEHLEGTIIEKIYVPSRTKVGDAPYAGVRRIQLSVKVEQEEQWIAIVRTDGGDTLTVHCHPVHYGMKNVGDRIHFREYEGALVHIRYFARGEEEGDR